MMRMDLGEYVGDDPERRGSSRSNQRMKELLRMKIHSTFKRNMVRERHRRVPWLVADYYHDNRDWHETDRQIFEDVLSIVFAKYATELGQYGKDKRWLREIWDKSARQLATFFPEYQQTRHVKDGQQGETATPRRNYYGYVDAKSREQRLHNLDSTGTVPVEGAAGGKAAPGTSGAGAARDTDEEETDSDDDAAAALQKAGLMAIDKVSLADLGLSAVPFDEYLDDGLVPVLFMSLLALVKKRPDDPVDFLARTLRKLNPQNRKRKQPG